jgi:ATP-dependent Lhr-like helicase
MKDEPDQILDFMLSTGVLHEDQGKIWFGAEGEKKFGYKNFLELFSVFTTPPLFTVLHGRTELGLVHDTTFAGAGKEGSCVLQLGGRSWAVTNIDWRNRRAFVAPAPAGGRSRWCGGSRSMHFEHARAIRRVLASGKLAGLPSQRAKDTLEQLRNEMAWIDDRSTTVVRDASGGVTWWTFAGLRANAMLATVLGDLVSESQVKDNLALSLRDHVRAEDVQQRLRQVDAANVVAPVAPEAIDELKFGACVPHDLVVEMLSRRVAEHQAVGAVIAEPVRSTHL